MTSGEYKDMSAIEALDKIKDCTLLLPDIQREYVWNPEDVEDLFNSIVDGYPIGSCIFWKTTKEVINRDQPNLYYFINRCERENSRAPKDATTNEKAPEFVTADGDYYIVLDGQQRITSLNIALRGKFKIKKRYKRNEWDEKELYYNLDFYSSEPNEDTPVKRFCFLTTTEATTGTYYRVKNIQAFPDVESFIQNVRDLTGKQRLDRQTSQDLITLYHRLIGSKTHRDKNSAIHYYCISEDNYDKALDIFVRVNSTGKKLSKSDLLFSTLINGWKEGKDIVTNTLKNMNQKGAEKDGGFNFTRDYLMRAALILVDQSVSLKIKSLNPKAVKEIREHWNRIDTAMDQMTDLLTDIGMYDERMTSYNASIPLAYYFYHGGEIKTPEARKEVRKFLAIAMTKGLFGVASNSSLTETRKVLQKIDCAKTPFSVSLFKNVVLTGNRTFTVSETDITNWIDTFEKGNNTYILLTLLYPHLKLNQAEFHQDHCHPWVLFENKNLAKLNLKPETVKKWQKMRNRLPNLQFLEGSENKSKNKTPLKKWIESGNTFAYRPDNVSFELKHFTKFYKLRRKLVLNELKTIFDLN